MHRNGDLPKDKTTFGILAAQSIQHADTAEEKGYDACKKVSGITRHIVVDTMGLPHAHAVTPSRCTRPYRRYCNDTITFGYFVESTKISC